MKFNENGLKDPGDMEGTHNSKGKSIDLDLDL